jgi:uncharacterized protein YukE
MTGADAPALRALAGQMSQSAVQLDRMRQTIRARVYAINWQGLDGVDFRRAWDAQHGPMLTRVAEGLRSTAQHLLREADQQEKASGVGGGALGAFHGTGTVGGPGGRPGGPDFGDLQNLLIVVGASREFIDRMLGSYRKEVGDFLHDAKWVEKYDRWVAEHLGPLRSSLSNVDEVAGDVSKFGKFLPVLGGVFAAAGQWSEDDKAKAGGAAFRPGEQEARAVVSGAVATGLDMFLDSTLVAGGAAAGFAVGGPAGAVAGGALGYAASTTIQVMVEDPLTDAAAWGVSRVYDGGEWLLDNRQGVVDYGVRVLDAGGDLLDAGGRIADDAGEAVGDFLHAVNPWGRP